MASSGEERQGSTYTLEERIAGIKQEGHGFIVEEHNTAVELENWLNGVVHQFKKALAEVRFSDGRFIVILEVWT